MAIGTPYLIPKDAALDGLEPHREHVQATVMSLMADCEAVFVAEG